jgi:isopropylmalate/homocitrate/citramalate synthase
MRSFKSQIRLQKFHVDEAQRRLTELVQLEDRLKEARIQLDAELVREQAEATKSFEASLTYGAFATSLVQRREKLELSLLEVAQSIEESREVLRDAFAELKKYELAASAAADRVRRTRDRTEQARQNEIGLTMFRQRAK